MSSDLGLDLHRNRIPEDLLLFEVAGVAEKGRGGGAKAKRCVFDDGALVADRVDEVGVVSVLFRVAGRRAEALARRGAHRVGAGLLIGILLPVAGEEVLADVLREGFEIVTGTGFAGDRVDREAVADVERDVALGADEAETLAATGASFEVDAKRDLVGRVLVGLRVIIEADHEIGDVAAVLPVVRTAAREDALGAVGIHDVVDAAEEVDEQVTRDTGAVILVVAPTEEADGLEGALGCGADEAVPIDGGGRGVVRDYVLPGAEGGVAVVEGFDHADFADFAILDHFTQTRVKNVADALAADLEDLAGGLLGGDDLVAIGGVLDHGLLTIDVLASLEGVNSLGAVPVVGRGDDDGVDVGAGQEFAVVAGGEDLLAESLFCVGEAAFVNVGDSDEFDAGYGGDGLDVSEAHVAHADAADTDLVIGGSLLCLSH